MASYVFTNNMSTTVATAVTTSATSITLSSSAHFPSSIPVGSYWAVTLNDAATHNNYEIIYVPSGGITGATLNNVLRGQEGTTAQAWAVNDIAFAAVTAGELAGFSAGPSYPISVGNGGTGSTNPSGVIAGTDILVTGSFPNQTVAVDTTKVVTSVQGAVGSVTVNSPDNSLSVATNGNTVSLQVNNTNAPIGSTIAKAAYFGTAPSIAIPAVTGGGTYIVDLIFSYNQTSNTNAGVTISLTGGTASQIFNTGSGLISQNASYYASAHWCGQAAAGQTLNFSISINGSSFDNNSGWIIRATRTA